MADVALCRYHCPNCDTELEQEGYLIIEADDDEPARALLNDTANVATCTNCGQASRLPLPLLYHDAEQELFIIFVADLAQLTPETLSEHIRFPYGVLVEREALRRGIELPEPDDAAFPRDEDAELRQQPGARFHALTQEQAMELLPEYLLRPTILDNFEVLRTAAQAAHDGMTGQEVVDDMARLQLINAIMSAPDPIARRKVLHQGGPYLNDDLYEVIDTLSEQMTSEGQPELVERLQVVKEQIQRYKQSQQQRLSKSKKKPARLSRNKGQKKANRDGDAVGLA